MNFQTRLLSENFGAQVLGVGFVQTDTDMAEADFIGGEGTCMPSLSPTATLRHLPQLSAVLKPVEEPPGTKSNHSQGFKAVIYIANINSLNATLIRGNVISRI